MSGQFFWHELMTTDTEAAERFYGSVVGWDFAKAPNGMDYTILQLPGTETGVAGLMPMPGDAPPGMRPCWVGYIAVDDVDEAAKKIAAEGGRILKPPFTIEGIIRLGVVSDPQGVVFIVARGLMGEMERPAPGTTGRVGWNELYALDGAAAFAFYEKMFGWTRDHAMDMGPMGVYQIFAIDGVQSGGIMSKPAQVPVPFWGFYFNVPALDAAIDRLTAGGGQVLNGPMEVPGGQWIVQAMDPQGAPFALVAMKR